MPNIKLHDAVRLALGLSAGAFAMSVAPGAMAQADQGNDAKTIEEVVVTGSRIKRADLESASPVTVLTREEMTSTGLTDVGNLLQRMPSMSGSPVGTTTNNGNNGTVLIDLRGMGTDRTLTLVNGQRVVDGGDYQTIPPSMIERVEILKDGASAVYGADAVAGVVNIITRRDFTGIEVTAQTADWFDSKGKQDAFGVIAGTEFAGGNFVFGAEYVKQNEAYQRDVPWEFMQDTFYIYPEGCENQLLAPYDGTPTGGCLRDGSSSIPEARFVLDGVTYNVANAAANPYEAGTPIEHDGRNYNYAPVNYLQTPYERTNIFAEAHFEVSPNVRFNTEFRGNFRNSAQELAPMPYFSILGDPAYDGFFNGEAYHGVSPDNYYLRQAIDNYNAANGTSLPYTPATDVRRRMLEQPRRFTQDVTQYQFTASLDGDIQGMDWEVFMNSGYRAQQDQDFGQYVGDRLSRALGPSADLTGGPGGTPDGIPECYLDVTDPDTLIEGCVPMNMFGGGGVVRATGEPTITSVTQDMLDYVSFTLNDSTTTKQTLAGASISGSAFELPGGQLGWAAGYGYWKQEYKYTPDSAKASSNVTGNKTSPTDGSLTNHSVYAELLAPVFDNGSQALDVKLGFRWDDYDAFDAESTYQLGLELQVIQDLKLRGTYGTVFRAPTITDLYGGLFDNFPTFSDPCAPANIAGSPGCDQTAPGDEGQLLSREGGNPFLTPETGDTFTTGVVWTPSFGDHNLTVTLDYWQIALEDGISSLGVQYILDDCYVNQNDASCALITRRPSDYGIQQVINGSLNVAEQGAKGVDTEVRWNFGSAVGQWQASFLWSHLIERTKTPFPGAAEEDLSGEYTDPTAEDGGGRAQDKINYSVQWAWNDLSIGYLGEYISDLEGQTFCNCFDGNRPDGTYWQKVDALLYHDLVATYEFPDYGVTLTGGVTNLTDEEPPFIDTGFNATTDQSNYRLFGRGYYLRASYKF